MGVVIGPSTITNTVLVNFFSSFGVFVRSYLFSARNLDTAFYANGDPIPEVRDPTEWANLTTGAWCYYNNDPVLGSIYGKLYNGYAVSDPRGLSPAGWRIPKRDSSTDPVFDDFFNFASFLGTDPGGKAKAVSSLWQSPNTNASNTSGFSALPAGQRSQTGTFTSINQLASFRMGNVSGASMTYGLGYNILYNTSTISIAAFTLKTGTSIRLVKDL
jgi:uncharacterized protein (TIGR02145 family)